ncbi:tRNA lysidine(34) synthetase TilS [Filimonas effusa]|uniref:tRNA(Ile)-lysidine synthase n=1 Tax=Filimonas effusa TaxID=2508721 RepID=A0A4Q1DEW3_9BACT|nr:tRNA lysidine(34) synthetase TilS [Filimonas effusa]RXK87159.1 tRNA lysidine(34) synthetase TilS [Filimonas effusa]
MHYRFTQYWQQHFPGIPMQHCRLVVAVSGGIDSVVLTHLLYRLNVDFVMVHCNFQLRGAESERDEAFVRALEQQYNRPVLVKRFDTAGYASAQKVAIQEAARTLRYSWFYEVLAAMEAEDNTISSKPHLLVTAHHANDNIETLLMNFFRGTGITGLHGILPKQKQLIRPLLFAKREEIAAYAAEHVLSWVEDASNASDKYTRNFFRLQLLPAIKNVFPQVEENLLHNIDRFTDIEILYRQSVSLSLGKLVEDKGTEKHIPILKLLKTPAAHTLLWEVLQPLQFSAAQVAEVMKLAGHGENSSYVASVAYRVIKNRNWLIIAPLPPAEAPHEAQHIVIEENDKRVAFRDGKLMLRNIPGINLDVTTHPGTALLNADKLSFPLLLRPWKQGDYFYPLGMDKKKKLSKFLIDQKVTATQKEKVWVLEMDQKIVWVVGIRIDNRFKITPSTASVLEVVFTTTA